jgi:hypothetical protein
MVAARGLCGEHDLRPLRRNGERLGMRIKMYLVDRGGVDGPVLPQGGHAWIHVTAGRFLPLQRLFIDFRYLLHFRAIKLTIDAVVNRHVFPVE